MKKAFSIFILFIYCFSIAAAQKPPVVFEDSVRVFADSGYEAEPEYNEEEETTVTFRDTSLYFNSICIPADSIQKWKKEKAFAYSYYLDSLLKVQKNKPKTIQKEPSSPSGGWVNSLFSSGLTQKILWLLAGLFVLFVIYKLFVADAVFKKTVVNKAADPVVESISEQTDFARGIQLAVMAGDFRLATRYHYVQTIQGLATKELISLAADKTNFQYVQEIKNEKLRLAFATLTLHYEYIWYGEFSIDEPLYRRIAAGFQELDQKIKTA